MHQANKLLIATRSRTQAEGAILPPVHGAQKHLDPTVKPEHDKHVPVSNQNKQESPTSADAKPKVLLRLKLPASQIARKKLIDRSIKLLNKPRPKISVPRKTPVVQKQSPIVQKGSPQQLPNDNVDNANPPPIANQPTSNSPVPVRHFEPNPLLEVSQPDQIPQETASQQPVQRTEDPVAKQDPFDTQMEVPFL